MTDEATKDTPQELTLIEHMATSAMSRVHAMGIKGKARDKEAITMFVGGALMLRAMGKQDHGFEAWVAIALCGRGYSECVHSVAKAYIRGCELPEVMGPDARSEALKKAQILGGRKA